MKIEFPAQYKIEHITGTLYHVNVPKEHVDAVVEMLKTQTWINRVFAEGNWISVHGSLGYTYTKEEARDALNTLAEHAMSSAANVAEEDA